MNFLKKKLKPLGLNYSTTVGKPGSSNHHHNKDLEDDLYDEYVVEAPPHPSELLALGVDPTEIDINNPQKLRELYRKAKEEGKCANSVLLARERQKEEIENKKKTKEEWKFFENLTARVEQAVKDSQKTLDQLKESSAIDKLSQPDYELVLTPDQIFKSSVAVNREKSISNWIKFSEDESETKQDKDAASSNAAKSDLIIGEQQPPEGDKVAETHNFVVEELLNDFGIDLRSDEQKKTASAELERQKTCSSKPTPPSPTQKQTDLYTKPVPRPRPRPNLGADNNNSVAENIEVDPFDTSFVEPHEDRLPELASPQEKIATSSTLADPFDTSFVNF